MESNQKDTEKVIVQVESGEIQGEVKKEESTN